MNYQLNRHAPPRGVAPPDMKIDLVERWTSNSIFELRGADNRLLSPQSRKVNHGEYFWFPLRGRKPKGARLPLPASHPGPRMGALALGRQSLPRQMEIFISPLSASRTSPVLSGRVGGQKIFL